MKIRTILMLGMLSVFAIPIWADQQEEDSENREKTVGASFAKTFPEALSDTALIDLSLDSILFGLGLMDNPLKLIPRALATLLGYSIRKTCNDYQSDEQGNKDLKVSTACGFAGGALKYITRAGLTGDEL